MSWLVRYYIYHKSALIDLAMHQVNWLCNWCSTLDWCFELLGMLAVLGLTVLLVPNCITIFKLGRNLNQGASILEVWAGFSIAPANQEQELHAAEVREEFRGPQMVSICHYAANSRKVSHWDVKRFFLRFHGGNCCRPRIRCHNGGRWNVERSATSGLKGWKTLKHVVFVTFLESFWANMRETSWENVAGVVLVSQLLQGIPFHSTALARHIVKPLSKWLTSKLSCWLFQSVYKYRDMGIC